MKSGINHESKCFLKDQVINEDLNCLVILIHRADVQSFDFLIRVC